MGVSLIYSRILVENRYPLVFGAPVRGEAVRFIYATTLGDEKTRMMGLSEGKRISMISSAVLIQSTCVADRLRARAALCAVAHLAEVSISDYIF